MSFEMSTVSAPNTAQSESYVSVAALFLVFHVAQKEEKVHLRLSSVWRDLWGEFLETHNGRINEADRDELRDIKTLVQNKLDNEDNEGVILTKAFQKRNAAVNDKGSITQRDAGEGTYGKRSPENLKEIWRQKRSTYNFQKMLVGFLCPCLLSPGCYCLTYSIAELKIPTTDMEFQGRGPRNNRSPTGGYHLWRNGMVCPLSAIFGGSKLIVMFQWQEYSDSFIYLGT